MDHSDHTGHAMMDMMDHAMSPYLFGNMKTFFLLFREAKVSTGGHLAAAVIVSIAFVALVTLFSAHSKKIEMKATASQKRFSAIKCAATAVFAIRMFFHYIGLLLVMSMNIWIILAVTFGHALGHLIYNAVVVSKYNHNGDAEKAANARGTPPTAEATA